MTRFAADVIDTVVGISEGSPLAQLRARRPEARTRAQSSYAVLFNPPDPGGLSPPERFEVALRVAELHGASMLAAHYRARLADDPSAATAVLLEELEEQGLTAAEIVTLSQIIAFVAYQVRVVASLALIEETP
jgi:uncharacterized protein YciW